MKPRGAKVEREIVLLGGGHSHVRVLKSFAMDPVPGARLTLISAEPYAPYSGMLPGHLAGWYTFEETHFDLQAIARSARARFIHSRVTGLDPVRRQVQLDGRPGIAYDLLSVNTGARPDLPEEACDPSVLAIRPVSQFLEGWRGLEARAARGEKLRIAVVGGGAAGVEIAMITRQKLRARVSLYHAGREVLPSHSARVRKLAMEALRERGVEVHLEEPFHRVPGESYDRVLWVTQVKAEPWVRESGLAVDTAGFLRVDRFFESPSHRGVFGAGDAIRFDDRELAKSGVFAVRQGPVLAWNLRQAALGSREFRAYRPQRSALALITTGEKDVIASRGTVGLRARWLWRWKDRIDRRFMEKFSATPMSSAENGQEMLCRGCGAKAGSTLLSRTLARLEADGVILSRPDVLSGIRDRGDAAVTQVPEGQVAVQSVDYFPALVDDPWLLGRIGARHALGDLHALGAEPQSALAIVQLAELDGESLQEEDLYQMLSGAARELGEAGAALVGGHTVLGDRLAFGLSVTGIGEPSRLRSKSGARPGDRLVLTSALGTGVLFAAEMRGLAQGDWISRAESSMLHALRLASDILNAAGVRSSTDITGFGLVGHLLEMLRASGVSAVLRLDAIPALPGAIESLERGVRSSLAPDNRRLGSAIENLAPWADSPRLELLFDPQTCGGLLAAVSAERVGSVLQDLQRAGYADAAEIGEIRAGPPLIRLKGAP